MLMKCLPAAILITGLSIYFLIPEEPLIIKITVQGHPHVIDFALRLHKCGKTGSLPILNTSWFILLHAWRWFVNLVRHRAFRLLDRPPFLYFGIL